MRIWDTWCRGWGQSHMESDVDFSRLLRLRISKVNFKSLWTVIKNLFVFIESCRSQWIRLHHNWGKDLFSFDCEDWQIRGYHKLYINWILACHLLKRCNTNSKSHITCDLTTLSLYWALPMILNLTSGRASIEIVSVSIVACLLISFEPIATSCWTIPIC